MKWWAIGVASVALLAVAYGLYMTQWVNPRVVRELYENPEG
jgi:hypothetical protein